MWEKIPIGNFFLGTPCRDQKPYGCPFWVLKRDSPWRNFAVNFVKLRDLWRLMLSRKLCNACKVYKYKFSGTTQSCLQGQRFHFGKVKWLQTCKAKVQTLHKKSSEVPYTRCTACE